MRISVRGPGTASRGDSVSPKGPGWQSDGHVMKSDIEKERGYAKIRENLEREFKEADENEDGYIERDELKRFLVRKVKQAAPNAFDQDDGAIDYEYGQLVDGIFREMGEGPDSVYVKTEQFVHNFYVTQVTVAEEISRLEEDIRDCESRREQIKEKLREIEQTERPTENRHPVHMDYFIMEESQLAVHVIDARDLKVGVDNRMLTKVKLRIEGQSSRTKGEANSTDPIWNERFLFDIATGRDPLKIELAQSLGNQPTNDTIIGTCDIDLKELSPQELGPDETHIDQQKQDKLWPLDFNGKKEGYGQLRLGMQWIYSKVKLLNDYIVELNKQIEDDQQQLDEKKVILDGMRRPFTLLLAKAANVARDVQRSSDLEEADRERAKKMADQLMATVAVSAREEAFARTVDNVATKVGIKKSSWSWFTFVMTFIFTVITCLVSFYKADFINLTVCVIAIHLLVNADQAKEGMFRVLVFVLIFSLLLDLLWFFLRGGGDGKDPEATSVESSVVTFSFVMAYISFFFKIVMSFVFWRTSISFESVIDQRSQLMQI